MPSLSTWISSNPNPLTSEVALRAELAYQRILDRPTSVVFRRKGVDQAAQTLRVEYHSRTRLETASSNSRGVSLATVFGIQNHSTQPDNVIERGDRFVIESTTFEVTNILLVPGEIQALCEVSNG